MGIFEGSPLLTAAEMRAAEAEAIAGGTPGLVLMERAAQAVVAAVQAHWPELGPGSRVCVLCGPGGNGGDGYAVARQLAARGWTVELHALAPAGQADAAAQAALWAGMGAIGDWDGTTGAVRRADLVIDALFGLGLTRPLDARLEPVLDAGAQRVLAIDLPSGLCSDSGRALGGRCFDADLTVSFHAPKRGHVLAEGPARCGSLDIRDIGLERTEAAVRLTQPPEGLGKRSGHKYGYGHALVLSGGVGRGGAARMAARAALRIGAGLVTMACPAAALQENAARLDAVMLRRLRDRAALDEMLEDERLNALLLGPGLGVRTRERDLVASALAARRSTVLDADALSLVAQDSELRAGLHGGCLLTPHDGEFARLFPDLADRLKEEANAGPAFSRVDAAREAAARAGCAVLLKGPDTVIAAPDGRMRVNAGVYGRAAPWLATAGAGDVLAGMAAGLMARGWPGFEAGCDAAWLHVAAARRFGPGLIAEDLPEQLSGLMREMGL
ncbi:NAD(P)H-hydrate dehydratase [Limimaricola litoreus]|uniref:Bifunctional NAD(P)H-hydrate repair enzyme n=1 Tax=Limimaricola litoreus TaxID=2955316 RepID=A0A9X2FXL7_9RHOB|nr:NAD(P)H-hydrate dehydratase [Limimaricola litoreus]MCP1170301.1 NAD(P)H-hydrate dehydratase [Limimaricola litoreus]